MKSEIFLYLNSNDFMDGKSNSVYDITSWKNQIFLCEFRRNRITVIDTKNKEILNNLHIPSPHGIYVTQTGKIYSVSMSNNEIYLFKKNFFGKYKLEKLSSNQKLVSPVSITYFKNNESFYIANWGTNEHDEYYDIISVDKKLNSYNPFYSEKDKKLLHYINVINSKLYAVYRKPPSVVILDENSNKLDEIIFDKNIDPLSISYFKKNFLIPNYKNGKIHVFNDKFEKIDLINLESTTPTNTTIINNTIYAVEENGNRIFKLNE